MRFIFWGCGLDQNGNKNSDMYDHYAAQGCEFDDENIPEKIDISKDNDLAYIIDLYYDIYSGCDITYSELKAYSELLDTNISALEAKVIHKIDRMRAQY